jgi:hypothetical protein
MAFLAVTCAIISGLRSYETFSFMSSGTMIDDLDSNDIDGYAKSLEAMGMEILKSSSSDGVRIVGTQRAQGGNVTVSLRISGNRLFLSGEWSGGFGIAGIMNRYRQRDLGEDLRRKYIDPWQALTNKTKR